MRRQVGRGAGRIFDGAKKMSTLFLHVDGHLQFLPVGLVGDAAYLPAAAVIKIQVISAEVVSAVAAVASMFR